MGDLFHWGPDKLQHLALYGWLAFIVGWALIPFSPRRGAVKRIVQAMLLLALISLAEEYRQWFLPNRKAELLDGLSNLAGIAAGSLLPLLAAVKGSPGSRAAQGYWKQALWLLLPLVVGLLILNEPVP